MMQEQIKPYKEFVRPHYANRDVAHSFRHIERIISRLDMLSEGMSSPPRRDRLHFLACFHGLGARLRDDEKFREQTTFFLQDLGWTLAEAQELFRSLERHLESPETVEEEIVHDANKVEILGAFGIAKAFTMGGILGQSYEETADYFEHQSLGKTVFRTPTGRRLAEEGRAYVLEFLTRLRREL
jgi:uncharacterized protein